MSWFQSTNAKEIGTLYLIFAVFAGMLGTAFSVLIRLELSSPGVQFLQGDHQLFNGASSNYVVRSASNITGSTRFNKSLD
jgi:heme/copper-type cytochrome/quinol oxidase subunit 1